MTWATTDSNGLPENPDWVYHQKTGNFPPANPDEDGGCNKEPDNKNCTSQPVLLDLPAFPNSALCVPFIPESHIHGHVEWSPAVLSGTVAWLNFADDWDYNLQFLPEPKLVAMTRHNSADEQNRQFLELEFDSEATVDTFVTPWWKSFRQVVAAFNDDGIRRALYPGCPGTRPKAVVVGLYGLDCEHDCHSELHPVYALAVETSPDPTDNVWVMFVRNWGNGGFCSRTNHLLNTPDRRLQILLPRESAGTPAVISDKTEFAHTAGIEIPFPQVQAVRGRGTMITFDMPDPAAGGVAELVLHLNWTNDTYVVPRCVAGRQFMMAPLWHQKAAVKTQPKDAKTAEEYLGALYRAKESRNLAPSAAAVPRGLVQRQNVLVPTPEVRVSEYTGQLSRPPSSAVQVKPATDAKKKDRDRDRLKALCDAYGNSPPTDKIADLDKTCKKLSK